MLLDVKCKNYSHFTMDLRWLNDYNKTNFFIATREQPSLMISIDALGFVNAHQREVKMEAGDHVLNYYLIPTPYEINTYDFSLLDYSLAYVNDGYLRVREHVSYEYGIIFSRDFYQENVFRVDLIPGYAYDLDVCSNVRSMCYSLGSLTASDNRTMLLKIDKPVLADGANNYNDLQIVLFKNDTSKTITLQYTTLSGTPVINATLNIFNPASSSRNTTLAYTAMLTSSTGTIVFTAPAVNDSFYAESILYTTSHGRLIQGKALAFYNATAYDHSAFNMTNFPNSYMGVDKSSWMKVAAFGLILTVTLVIAKATSLGYGIISGALAFGMLSIFSWTPSAIPSWMLVIMVIFGVGVKLAESRVEVVG
jgi:hypothetical protein